jgi:hypothetical protein
MAVAVIDPPTPPQPVGDGLVLCNFADSFLLKLPEIRNPSRCPWMASALHKPMHDVVDARGVEGFLAIARATDEPAQHHVVESLTSLIQLGVMVAAIAALLALVGDEHDPILAGAGHDALRRRGVTSAFVTPLPAQKSAQALINGTCGSIRSTLSWARLVLPPRA